MSVAGDLREALQDVVAPDLKAVVLGLTDLREETRSNFALLRQEIQSNNALLRDEIQKGNALLRREIEQTRQESRENMAILREDTRQHILLLRDEARTYEARSVERTHHLQDALKLELATRRNAELEEQMKQMRSAQASQQH